MLAACANITFFSYFFLFTKRSFDCCNFCIIRWVRILNRLMTLCWKACRESKSPTTLHPIPPLFLWKQNNRSCYSESTLKFQPLVIILRLLTILPPNVSFHDFLLNSHAMLNPKSERRGEKRREREDSLQIAIKCILFLRRLFIHMPPAAHLKAQKPETRGSRFSTFWNLVNVEIFLIIRVKSEEKKREKETEI